MNCRVCGNAVGNYERVCSVCGNDMEAQRREAAGTGFAAPGAFYSSSQSPPPPPAVSLAREKDEAINRILYDDEGASAGDRLEERRKKRQSEKASSHTGFTSFFTQDRKGQSADRPAAPEAPAAPAAPAYETARINPETEQEKRPFRNFSSEFVFGEAKRPAAMPVQPEGPAGYNPSQQAFAVPAAPATGSYAPQQAAAPGMQPAPAYAAPSADSYFTLTPSDEEQAKFNVDKKNEEFQELLDKEFERLKRRETETIELQNQIDATHDGAMPQSETDIRSYIQERIDSYLRQKDLDMTLSMRSRAEEPLPAVQPAPAAPAYEPAAPAYTPVPPAYAPAPAPAYEPAAPAYEPAAPAYEPAAPAYEPAAPAYEPTAPAYEPAAPAYEPAAPVYEPAAPAYEPAPVPAPPTEPPKAGFEAFNIPPVQGADPVSAFTMEPGPIPAPPAEPGIVPPGHSRNEAPTRESIAEFLDRPIVFPFDTKTAAQPPAFDFEPIEPAFEAPPEPAIPAAAVIPEPVGFAAPAISETSQNQEIEAELQLLEEFDIPVASVDEAQPSVIEQTYCSRPGADEAQPRAFERTYCCIPAARANEAPASEAAEEFAAPFAFDQLGGAETDGPEVSAAAEPVKKADDPSDWFTAAPMAPAAEQAAEAAPVQETAKTGEALSQEPDKQPQPIAPGFIDLITEKPTEEIEDPDGPPQFYKAYTQGFSASKIEAGAAEASAPGEAQEEAAEKMPDFLTAYDDEQLGTTTPVSDDKKPSKAGSARKKQENTDQQSDAKRTALSIVITILIVILVIVVACIIILKFMPDSIGAYYIQDAIEMVQDRLGIGRE